MKSNLTLIQPTEYNNLFSSYHNEVKTNKYKYNLPKIYKLFSSTNTKTNKIFNDLKIKLKANKFSNLINEKKNLAYPLLNISVNNKTMTKAKTNLDSINYNMEELRDNNIHLIKKANVKRSNIHRLKMVYLNLFNIKSEKKNDSIMNFDSFFNNIDNFEMFNNEEDKILSQKLKEINNKSIIKIINIFNETNFDKLNNDFLSINNIQNSYLSHFAERLLNKYKADVNINTDDNNSINSFNKSQERHNLINNNVFFDWILDNVKHKIELKNEYNQHLTTVWIQNLINNEINQLKNKFMELKQSLNLSNFFQTQKQNNSLNNRIIKRKDDSYFTESTYRTKMNQSKRKSSINNNNSNIISNYNSSYEMDDNNKIKLNYNYTISEMNAGFDLFSHKPKMVRAIKPINTKNIYNFVMKTNIKFNAINNKTNYDLNKSDIKKTFNKSQNKTELNEEYHGQNTNLFKNLYVNNPRSNKIKNFKLNIPDNINSKIPVINNEINNSRFSLSKKNFDIIEKINNKTNNNNSTINNFNSDVDNSFVSIEKAKSKIKKRNSINFTPIQFTSFNNFKIKTQININEISYSKPNTPKKYILHKKRGSEISNIPKFKNNLAVKKIVSSLFKEGKYKPKFKEASESSNSSYYSGSSDDSSSDDSSDESDDNNQINSNNSKRKKSKMKIKKKAKKKKNREDSKTDVKTKKKKTKKKEKLAIKMAKIKEENEQELLKKIEKNDLIKNLNKSLIMAKGKHNKFTYDDINELKKIFSIKTKSKKENKKSKKKENKKENKKDNKKIKKKKIEKRASIKNMSQEKEEIEEVEEEEETIIYSISSNSNEDEDINENLQIKNEVDIMNLLLSNTESRNLFNDIFELKKLLRKKEKTEEDKEAIRENKTQIKGVVNKYFDLLLSKLSNNHIKKENIHINVLNELNLIQKYGIYTNKDLRKLMRRVMQERYNDDKEDTNYDRYNKYYYYDEYEEYFGTKKKKHRIMKKSASAEVKMKKNAFKKFIRIKYDNIKSKFKPQKKNLIYNNSYLYRDNHSDNEEHHTYIIKKEIQDILDKEYNEIIKAKKEEIFREKKRKEREVFFKKKAQFKKKTQKRQIIKLIDDPINEELNKNNVVNEEIKKELEKEKERDRKMYEFFGKIQKLKKRRDSFDVEKVYQFIDQEIEKNIMLKNKQRLHHFLEDFNLNRIRAKNTSVSNNKRIGFLSPIIFISPNENNSLTNYINYK